MLYARQGERYLGAVTPEDGGADVPLLAPFRPASPSPILPPARDQQVVMDPVRPSMYLGMGLASSREEFLTGEITTTSKTLTRIRNQAEEYLSPYLTEKDTTATGTRTPVDPVAPDLTPPGDEPSGDEPAPSAKEPAPEDGVVVASLLAQGDIEEAVQYMVGLDASTRKDVYTYLYQISTFPKQIDNFKAKVDAALKGNGEVSFWDRTIAGPVQVKHAAIGLGVLAAIGVTIKLIR